MNQSISARRFGLIVGLILGLGAPIGGLLFRALIFRQFNFHSMVLEIDDKFYYYFYMAIITPLAFGAFGYYLGSLNDKIQSQKQKLESLMSVLEAQSMTDDVTGLYNHRHLLEEIEKEIERSKRHHHDLSAMMIDLDGFKQINDLYGHITGDSVLRETALVINQSIRKIDVVGRYGGDEFVVILPEAKIEAAKTVAERILENVRQHRFKTKRDYVSLTVSIGIFSYEDSKDLDRAVFIEKIDEAMFKAKSSGKDRMSVLG